MADPYYGFLVSHAYSIEMALLTVDKIEFGKAVEALRKEAYTAKQIYVCGNGGSASIANHWACDHSKGLHSCGIDSLHSTSLSANPSLITAIGNDFSFEDIYAYQIKMIEDSLPIIPDRILVAISSSGNSENIVRAIEEAKECHWKTIAITGFDRDNRCNQIADIVLHVDSHDYGVVEDAHQAIMHTLAKVIKTIDKPV